MIVVHNIVIPVPEGDEYVTPDFERVLNYYLGYVKGCANQDIKPFGKRGYILAVCNELAKSGIVRDGELRTKDQILQRVMQHFGLAWLEKELKES